MPGDGGALTLDQVAQARLVRLRLSGAPAPSPEAVVRDLVAVQAQEYGPATWSIAARTRGAVAADLDAAVASGVLVRTHVLRPTWHLVARQDIRLLLDVTAPRVHAKNAPYYARVGLDDDARLRSQRVLVDALRGGNVLTRAEIVAVLQGAGFRTDALHGAYLLMRAELDAVICSGPRRGRQPTYALFDERVPHHPGLAPEAGLAELTRRYFTSHGPATVTDFAWWSSLTVGQIRRGLALVGDALASATVDGLRVWYAPPLPGGPPPGPSVHLLQPYDEAAVGYTESRRALLLEGQRRGWPLQAPRYYGVVLVDGQVAGSWRDRPSRGGALVLDVALYAPLDAAHAECLDAEARRYAAFRGAADVTVALATS